MMRLIEFFKNFFGDGKSSSPYRHYSVEYYPLANVYFALFKGRYLRTDYFTGIIKPLDTFLSFYGDKHRTEKDAWNMIDMHREQNEKENVKVIRRD